MKYRFIIFFLLTLSLVEMRPASSTDGKETTTLDGVSRVVSTKVDDKPIADSPIMLSPLTQLQQARSASLEVYFEDQRAEKEAQEKEKWELELAKALSLSTADTPADTTDSELAEAIQLSLQNDPPPLYSSSLPSLPASSLGSPALSTLPSVLASDKKFDSPSTFLSAKDQEEFDMQSAITQSKFEYGKKRRDDIDRQLAFIRSTDIKLMEEGDALLHESMSLISLTDMGDKSAVAARREAIDLRRGEISSLRTALSEETRKLNEEWMASLGEQ